MFQNYLKIAWRNLRKDRQFTFLNLVGLSTGLACALLIWLWIKDERNVDHYNEKDKQLYQVMQNIRHDGLIETTPNTAGLLANALAEKMPEIEYAATVVQASWFDNDGILTSGETRLKARRQFVSQHYFDVFSCPFIEGDNKKVLSDKHSIAISDVLANKLFHSASNAVGKNIMWSDGEFTGSYQITGVFKKNPTNATDQFDMIFNFDLFVEKRPGMEDWGNSDPATFVILKNGTNVDQFNAKIKNFVTRQGKEDTKDLFAIKFSEKYLHDTFKDGKQTGSGRIAYVKLFNIIGIFILVIACINFMNLSTAKASRRIKEVGIKKVVGARRGSLVVQYLGESVFISFLSLILAIVLIALLLPAFNQITGKTLNFQFDATLILSVLGITLLTGLIAGSYPALYISGFSPALVLKGKLKTSIGEVWVRKGLVVFQFTLSVIGIVAVSIVYKQIDYIQSKNLGYSRDNVINFEIPLEFDSAKMVAAESFVKEIRDLPGVVSAGSHSHNLNGNHGGIGGFSWPGKNPTQDLEFANLEVGYGFIQTVGIQMKEGKGFSDDNRSFKEIIFNETAIKTMGLKDPIGKTVVFWGQPHVIVGVAKDFNFESLYNTVKPCFFQDFPIGPGIVVKIKAGTEKQTIERIKTAFTSFSKGLAFDYHFMDEDYEALYKAENRVSVLSGYFAGLAILISCLGLFGLAAFTAQRRQKEIGIRKVVGATVTNVAVMLSKDFIRMVIVAIVIGFPLVWWIMNNWLQGFAYRVPINAGIFIVAAIAIILVTIITIIFQAIKAAVANPVKSLRTE
ncbi:MAG TPA: FtsX-like permease family protein [Chitinophagaceae bacterium]|jgi:putative ABC transport system permease protein|nr:FtsX-like permease family protein [Chitinophagaceae bacterium]